MADDEYLRVHKLKDQMPIGGKKFLGIQLSGKNPNTNNGVPYEDGKDWDFPDLIDYIDDLNPYISGIAFLTESLFQLNNLTKFLELLRKNSDIPIFVYTDYAFVKIPKQTLKHIDVVIDRYRDMHTSRIKDLEGTKR